MHVLVLPTAPDSRHTTVCSLHRTGGVFLLCECCHDDATVSPHMGALARPSGDLPLHHLQVGVYLTTPPRGTIYMYMTTPPRGTIYMYMTTPPRGTPYMYMYVWSQSMRCLIRRGNNAMEVKTTHHNLLKTVMFQRKVANSNCTCKRTKKVIYM